MGLLGAIYEFDGAIPSLDAIEKTVRELYPEALVLEGTLDSTDEDERDFQAARPSGNTLLMRRTHATLRVTRDRAKWSRSVDLSASLDGTKLALDGNDGRLFKAACDAVVSLSGRTYRKAQKPGSRHDVPFEGLDSETQAAIERAEEQADCGEGTAAGEAFQQLRRKHFGK